MNGNKQKVSVIIPTYNGSAAVADAAKSILAQTYKNIELIVVDDNGLNSPEQIKTQLALSDFISSGSLTYIPLEKNSGGSCARNTGARASSGEYLMFLDDDDRVSPNKIEIQYNALASRSADYVMAYSSTSVYINGSFSNKIKARKNGSILYDYMMGRVYIGTGTALIRRAAWQELNGYDESFVRHQDWEFFARVLNNKKAVATPEAEFYRNILKRNNPSNIQKAELYSEHYIDFISGYPFCLSAFKKRRIINRNNSRIALQHLMNERNFSEFARVMKKYDNPVFAYSELLIFTASAVWDKLIGKKS